jgi:hypothetical protein
MWLKDTISNAQMVFVYILEAALRRHMYSLETAVYVA